MKLITLIFILISFSNIYAQKGDFEIGLHFSPSLTTNQGSFDSPSAGFSTGVFTSLNISERIAWGVGLEWTLLSPENNLLRFNNLYGWQKFNFMRMPFWFSISLNDDLESKLQYHFIIGYAFGKILNAEKAINDYGLSGLNPSVHFAKFGLEVKFKFAENYRIAMGPQLELTNIYDIRYGSIYNFQYVIRVGRLLR